MIHGYEIIKASATAATNAALTASKAFKDGRIQNEETFTDRMIGAIEERFRSLRTKGISWTAMTLTAHQRNAQETEFGADLLGVLEIDLPDFTVKKGFLAQAKLVAPDESFSQAEFDRLVKQCEAMLRHSPDSYVFLYTQEDIAVVPAISVVGLRERRNPHELYRRWIRKFFEEHFESFIGDRRLYRLDPATLDELRAAVAARRALFLKAVG